MSEVERRDAWSESWLTPARRAVGCLVVLLLTVSAQAQQRGTATPAASPRSAGIVGLVIDGRTKAPLRDVDVSLGERANPSFPSLTHVTVVRTNGDGRFAFPDVASGIYGITAQRRGWRTSAYGAAGPQDVPQPLHVSTGGSTYVVITLWPLATIEGIVRDEGGEPLVSARVSFLQRRVSAGGNRQTVAVDEGRTDHEGRFRARVADGEYVVSASTTQTRVRLSADRQRITSGFVRTFYPDAQSMADAEAIVVTPGQERTGVELRLPVRRLVTVSGLLRRGGHSGALPDAVEFRSRDLDTSRRARVDAEGHFVVQDLLPGEYVLSASASPDGPLPSSPALWARALITVGSEDGEVTIDLRRRLLVSGRVEFDGPDAPTAAMLQALGVSFTSPGSSGIATIQADGRFMVGLTAGRYLVSDLPTFTIKDDAIVEARSDRWRLRSVLLGSLDVSNRSLDLLSDTSDLRLVFTSRIPRIGGRVTTVRGVLEPVTVVLFPDDPARWDDPGSGLYVMKVSGSDAAYTTIARPGDYLVAAVCASELAYGDRDMLAALAPHATRASLRDGDVLTVDLRAVDLPALAPRPPRETPGLEAGVDVLRTTPMTRAMPLPAGVTLTGRVVAAGTLTPLPDVRVSPSPYPSDAAAFTDDEGRFVLTGVAAHERKLFASKPSWGTAVIDVGEPADNLTIDMTRGTVLDIDVLDAAGEPLTASIDVYLYRWQAGGTKVEIAAGGGYVVRTRGSGYRIVDLPAGDYLVHVQPDASDDTDIRVTSQADIERASGRSSRVTPPLPVQTPWRYAPIILPRLPDTTVTETVHLDAGDERVVVAHAVRVPLSTISGTIRTGDTRPEYLSIRLRALDPLLAYVSDTPGEISVQPSGAFTIEKVPPGRYAVAVRGGTPSGGQLALLTEILATGQDQDGVVFDLQPTVTISGRVRLDGNVPSPEVMATLRIEAAAQPPMDDYRATVAAITGPDGRFTISNVLPGVNRVTIQRRTPSSPLSLNAVRVNGRETIDTGFTIEPGRRLDDVELLVTTAAAELSGTIRNAGGNVVIVVFPAAPDGWATSRRIFATRPDEQGRYVLRLVPPGDYFVTAATGLAPNDWFNPAVLATLTRAAVPLTIDRARVELDLTAGAR